MITAANTRLMTPLVGAMLAVAFSGSAAWAGACDRTTASASTACMRQAEGGYHIGLGVCANLDTSEQEQCAARAKHRLSAARNDCQEQVKARSKVCQALGQGRYDPVIRPSDFVAEITNPYFPLKPGTTFTYKGKDSLVVVRVTSRTKQILGVTCVVVQDTNLVDGKIEEDTFDYFAQDRHGNVWYFGEATAEYKNGIPVSTHGSWIAGKNGAKPGIVMPASRKLGVTYRQEFLLGEAEDLARIEEHGAHVSVPYGNFNNALKTFDFTPLEPELRENKYYVPGVGLVLTVDRVTGEREELISIEHD